MLSMFRCFADWHAIFTIAMPVKYTQRRPFVAIVAIIMNSCALVLFGLFWHLFEFDVYQGDERLDVENVWCLKKYNSDGHATHSGV